MLRMLASATIKERSFSSPVWSRSSFLKQDRKKNVLGLFLCACVIIFMFLYMCIYTYEITIFPLVESYVLY